MLGAKNAERKKASLDDRFDFVGDAVALDSRAELRPAIFQVEEREHLHRHQSFAAPCGAHPSCDYSHAIGPKAI